MSIVQTSQQLAAAGTTFVKNWTPTLVGYGVAGGLAGLYFTDKWIGKAVLKYVPFIGSQWK
eukprot:m.222167 g.222167  ORF g.222167 m.222167 type:complete len:61 (+) comp15973_c0_seq1:3508-3690(+)